MAVKVDSNAGRPGDQDAVVLIDALRARRKASNYVANHLGDRLMGIEPVFVSGERPIWNVPIVLTAQELGSQGVVGSVDIDAVTGEVLINEVQKQTLMRDALDLARRTAAKPGR